MGRAEKLTHGAGAAEIFADPLESSGAGMALQSCHELRQGA